MKSEEIIECIAERMKDFEGIHGEAPTSLYVDEKLWFSRSFIKATEHNPLALSWYLHGMRVFPTTRLSSGYIQLSRGDKQMEFALKKRLPFADELPGRQYNL